MVKIILLALFLRLWNLSSLPSSLNWDEISQGYTAYSIAQTGRDEWGEPLPIFFRSYGEWKSAVYIYLLVPFIHLLGLTPLAIRLPSAIAGLISVYLIYLIGKKIYSREVGLWAAFLMAVTPWSLFLSRPAFEANVALTLVLAGIYFFLRSVTNFYFLIPSSIFFGLAPHTYNSAKVVVPLLVLYLIISSKMLKNIKATLVYLVILAFFAVPIVGNLFSGYTQARFNQVSILTDHDSLTQFYELRKTFPFGEQLAKLTINKGSYFAYQFVNNFLSYFSPNFLIWEGGSHTQQSLPYHGVMFVSELLLLILGSYALLKSKKFALPLAIILLGLIPSSMTRDPMHALRSILALPGFILIMAVGAKYVMEHFPRWVGVLKGVLALELVLYLLVYFTWYGPSYARDWQYGYKELSNYLDYHAQEYDRIIMTKWYGEPQLFLAFFGRWDPTWYQTQNRQNIIYEQSGKMWLDQLESYSIGKYTFKYLTPDQDPHDQNILYVGKADDFAQSTPKLKTIYYPDGSVAFHLVRGDNLR